MYTETVTTVRKNTSNSRLELYNFALHAVHHWGYQWRTQDACRRIYTQTQYTLHVPGGERWR